jgi:hypothetical protein
MSTFISFWCFLIMPQQWSNLIPLTFIHLLIKIECYQTRHFYQMSGTSKYLTRYGRLNNSDLCWFSVGPGMFWDFVEKTTLDLYNIYIFMHYMSYHYSYSIFTFICMFCRSLLFLLYHCVVFSSSIYGFWLPLWYFQTLLRLHNAQYKRKQHLNIKQWQSKTTYYSIV